ncbi:MAG TPA: hypothetical protein PKA28_11185 [Methylomusa anaerophila]|uniref:Restriction endonuclease type IV Mrr domain-containing protein n=1 Tax=Methylomusa anaerophila TaxID=1930071 RepID=A0A348AJ74_9FIRM|nr:hypothetical protein [Methylomusa anaerophila]BBB91122.1 hypothetical protein MAMMFC1_01791 [Methylomusa anaerophila]HML88999.1 hypothetical protein [Methylomusa anaerophila]
MAIIPTLSDERIVRELLEAIPKIDSVQTLTLEKDAVIAGRTSSHQADIYWEFAEGDIVFKTVIQVRNWNSRLDRAELFQLAASIQDISGLTIGVKFTQPVYQKDVKKIAADAGIILYEINAADQPLWEPVVDNINIDFDAEWAREEKERVGLGNELIDFRGRPGQLFLYNEAGNCIDSLQGVFDRYVIGKQKAGNRERESIIHNFGEPTFLQTNNEFIPHVKIHGVAFDIAFYDLNELQGEDMANSILDAIFSYYRS